MIAVSLTKHAPFEAGDKEIDILFVSMVTQLRILF